MSKVVSITHHVHNKPITSKLNCNSDVKISTIPTLIERGHHISGPAHCIQCRYKWTAVAPVGVSELECPECRTLKGVFTYSIESEHAIWNCVCGCDQFIISELTNVICRKCGVIQGQFVQG